MHPRDTDQSINADAGGLNGLVAQLASADSLGKIMLPVVLFFKLHGQLEVTAWEFQNGVLLQTPTQC